MVIFSSEQYQSHLQKVPADIKKILFADETAQAIKKVALRYEVGDKSFDVAAQIGYTLVGLIPVKKFIQALQENADLDEETAKNIAQDIRAEIFAPVAQSLSNIQSEAEKNWMEAKDNTEFELENRARGLLEDAYKEDAENKQQEAQPAANDAQQVPGSSSANRPEQNNKSKTLPEETDDTTKTPLSSPTQQAGSQGDVNKGTQNNPEQRIKETETMPSTKEEDKTMLDVEDASKTKPPAPPQQQSASTPEPPSEKPQQPQHEEPKQTPPQPAQKSPTPKSSPQPTQEPAQEKPPTPEGPQQPAQEPAQQKPPSQQPTQNQPQKSTPPPPDLPTPNTDNNELDDKLKDEIFPKPE